MASGKKRKASTGNTVGMVIVGVVVGILIIVLLMQSNTLEKKIASYTTANEELQYEIQAENDRTEELKTLPEYVESDEFIEKTAREKFGLVYEDEIIFMPEEE